MVILIWCINEILFWCQWQIASQLLVLKESIFLQLDIYILHFLIKM